MVTINGIKFGDGIPKICVPIVEVNEADILAEALKIKNLDCHVVEWRIDFYENVFDFVSVNHILPKIKTALGDKLLLVTFRTKQEGGQKEIDANTYKELMKIIADSKAADIIDVELFMGDDLFKEIVQYAHENECYVIASNHDFHKTPKFDEIVNRLVRMKELCADISKIAVMPESNEDVAELLKATAFIKDNHKDITVVSMSMGKIGAISRIAGQIFGSAMTFATVDKPSAPGQIQIDKLSVIMKELDEIYGD